MQFTVNLTMLDHYNDSLSVINMFSTYMDLFSCVNIIDDMRKTRIACLVYTWTSCVENYQVMTDVAKT